MKYKKLLKLAKHIDRSFFIGDEFKPYSKSDQPLPIGYGQTISQPSLVWYKTFLLKIENDCTVKDYKITVPYLAEKMELVDNRDFIDLDEYRHLLKIKFQPSYSTNEKVTVTFSKPILEVDFIPNDSPDQIWLKPLGFGNVTVTVTTENGITATKEYIVK